MKKFEIWMEGFSATGESAPASLLGTSNGDTFKDAVIAFMDTRPDLGLQFDTSRMTYWGCRLYPTYKMARKSFG
jgi:hypothetical protein